VPLEVQQDDSSWAVAFGSYADAGEASAKISVLLESPQGLQVKLDLVLRTLDDAVPQLN
jgi:hypothetical protein